MESNSSLGCEAQAVLLNKQIERNEERESTDENLKYVEMNKTPCYML